jgi:uncharacterized phage protein (TIGR01671 family)
MREIKFLAFDKSTGKVAEVIEYRPNNGSVWLAGYDYELSYGDYNLMQFTGLHDKNEKEIYEGFVLKIPKLIDRGFGDGLDDYVTNVTFEDGSFMASDYLRMVNDDCEVIGNIYENPELLENEQS